MRVILAHAGAMLIFSICILPVLTDERRRQSTEAWPTIDVYDHIGIRYYDDIVWQFAKMLTLYVPPIIETHLLICHDHRFHSEGQHEWPNLVKKMSGFDRRLHG